jgi:hypothetical protein
MPRLVQIGLAREAAGFHLVTTVYGSGPVQGSGPRCLLKGRGARPTLNEIFCAADTREEGPGSSQADPLPLLRLQSGRRYGSDGTE